MTHLILILVRNLSIKLLIATNSSIFNLELFNYLIKNSKIDEIQKIETWGFSDSQLLWSDPTETAL